MADRHKTPLLGWHPPAGLAAWIRAEAERRGLTLRVFLDDVLTRERERSENAHGSE